MAKQTLTLADVSATMKELGVPVAIPVSQWEQHASGLFPWTNTRARRYVWKHANELVEAGALVRLDRELVVMSAQFVLWIMAQTNTVVNYDVPANRPEHRQKRFGNGKFRARRGRVTTAKRAAKNAVA